jgi:hypothetical protein
VTPVAPAAEAVLTRDQVCAWLQISERQFYRLNLPAIRVGKRGVRYHVGTVLEHLKRRQVA